MGKGVYHKWLLKLVPVLPGLRGHGVAQLGAWTLGLASKGLFFMSEFARTCGPGFCGKGFTSDYFSLFSHWYSMLLERGIFSWLEFVVHKGDE